MPLSLHCCWCFVFFSVLPTARAQQHSPDSLAQGENYVRFTYDNDFFNATDRYYTQGVMFTVIHHSLKYSPVFNILAGLRSSRIYYGITIEQDVFTPKSIRYNGGAVYYGERPFTAVFFLSHHMTSLNSGSKMLLRSQFDLGILGPAALGEEEQKAIHKGLNNIEPLGWENQLSQDYIINYRLLLEKGLMNSRNFDFMLSAGSRIGTLYTDVAAGMKLRLGRMNPYFTTLNFDPQGKQKFRIFCTLNGNMKLVGYNATLQGGMFNKNNIYELTDNAVKRIVASLSAGIVLAYKRISIEFTRYYLTPEFEGGVDHGWGRCEFSYSF